MDDKRWAGEITPTDGVVEDYRRQLQLHTNANGLCPICDVWRCEKWIEAYDRLALAGVLMGLPPD